VAKKHEKMGSNPAKTGRVIGSNLVRSAPNFAEVIF